MTRVAVIVPAHRETDSLRLLLRSLEAVQDEAELQVVVAVDGAHAATVEVARSAGATVVALPVNGGSYTARNAALDVLAPDVQAVLFTDADCVVQPGWVRHHLAALQTAPLSGGGVRFTFRGRRPTPPEWVDSVRHLKQEVYVNIEGYAATCNLAVRAEVVRRLRFDSARRTGGDVDFCHRARAEGLALAWTPEAGVEHPARDLRELARKARRLVGGMPGHAHRLRERPLPSRRLTRGVWRRAQAAGHDVGPVWGVTACLIDWSLSLSQRRALRRVQRAGAGG